MKILLTTLRRFFPSDDNCKMIIQVSNRGPQMQCSVVTGCAIGRSGALSFIVED